MNRYRDVLRAILDHESNQLPDCAYCYGVYEHEPDCPIVQARALLATEPAILGEVPSPPFSDGEIAQRKERTARARVAVRAYLEEQGVSEPVDVYLTQIIRWPEHSVVSLFGISDQRRYETDVAVPHDPAREPVITKWHSDAVR